VLSLEMQESKQAFRKKVILFYAPCHKTFGAIHCLSAKQSTGNKGYTCRSYFRKEMIVKTLLRNVKSAANQIQPMDASGG
jgi:hypothetical protein